MRAHNLLLPVLLLVSPIVLADADEVQSEGKTWPFEIDGGGTATWKAPGSATRYWGCSVKECEPLALLLTDFVEG